MTEKEIQDLIDLAAELDGQDQLGDEIAWLLGDATDADDDGLSLAERRWYEGQ
jgi:hypothetical protein